MGRILEIFFFIYIGYVILKNIGSFLSGGSSSQRTTQDYSSSQQQRTTREGEIHVEHVPDTKSPSSPKAKDSEYIPFDEVKE